PVSYKGLTYGLPESEEFQMMFYRKDILQSAKINAQPPQDWTEVKVLIRELQKNNLTFGLGNMVAFSNTGMGMASGFVPYLTFLFQNGGKLYYNDGERSALTDKVALEQFKEYTSYYTQWKLLYAYNFPTMFSSGEMPVGIALYSIYNQLLMYAPEISSLWDMVPVPGIRKPDGSIDRSSPSIVYGALMLRQSKNKDKAWEFLKWWTEAETIVNYSRELESLIGPVGRMLTANKEALEKLPWSADVLNKLKSQQSWLVGVPEVPGSYNTQRYVDFAYRDVIIHGIDPAEAFPDYVRRIDEELARKQEEFFGKK
ncbi:MAG TPA: extracellular solute-binding protein, partial [Clostridia bacterium]|nr:extracellular solute-binding protein [Clostridia bacterium]